MEPPACCGDEQQEAGPSMERASEAEPVPSRWEMITPRSVGVSVVLGVTLSVVAMKLSLTSSFLPTLSIPAGLLGLFLSRAWVRLADCSEVAYLPFTRQENTVILTCVVACSDIAYTGGFGSYILAMSKSAAVGGAGWNVVQPNVYRLIAFLFLTSFAGLFAILPFRDYLIVRHNLTFPSGTATAHLINTMHTPNGAKKAGKQVSALIKTFVGTITWSVFEWFFTGGGPNCGFRVFPTFGLAAFRRGFYFDFSLGTIGIGMLSAYRISASMLLGSLVSWGILWPYIETKEGTWYPRGLDDHDLCGINGYRVLIGISMIFADSLVHLLCITQRTLSTMCKKWRQTQTAPLRCLSSVDERVLARSFDDRRRAQVFLRDRVSNPAAVLCYVALSAVSVVIIPQLYPQLRYHHVAVAYLAAPVLAFCNAYGYGVTDMNVATIYGKIAMLVFASWVGLGDGGVVAGLAACGIIVSAIAPAADFIHESRTGYLTLTSPHTVLISQIAGTALGCVINPLVFWAFYKLYDGDGDGLDNVPYAKLYRGIAVLGTGAKGGGLPGHSMHLCRAFFTLALAIALLREVSARRRWRVGRYIPSTIAVATAFFVSPKTSIGMCIGSLVIYLWKRHDRDDAHMLSPAVAAGLICGDGFGTLLKSLLAMFKARAPICIMFLSRDVNARLDAYLATIHKS